MLKVTRPRRLGGFTLIEMMVVLAISAIGIFYAMQKTKQIAEDQMATASADNATAVGKALNTYISNNTTSLGAVASTGLTVAQMQTIGTCGAGSSCLASTFQPVSWMGGWTAKVVRIGGAAPYQFEALVCTDNGWIVNGKTRIDMTGNAVAKIGGLGGMSYDATGATGNNGSWSAPVATYPFANVAGKLCYFVSQSLTALDLMYLRTDGTNKMNATLQMNSNDINAAKNVSASGNIVAVGNITSKDMISNGNISSTGNMIATGSISATGNVSGQDMNALGSMSAVNMNASGSVNAAGNVNASGNMAAQNITVISAVNSATLNSTTVNSTTVNASDKVIATNDVEISTLTSRPNNGQVSTATTTTSVKTLLPKLVEMGTQGLTFDGEGIRTPACLSGGSGLVFVIPQQVRGTFTNSTWGTTMYATPQGSGPWTLYARRSDNSSMVAEGGAPYIALARTFCSY